MPVTIFHVDAFTDKLFGGNPAAVCILPSSPHDHWMQQFASEMNLSETAFVLKQKDGYALRWFTPTTEVDLCGHATLASAHVLWESGLLKTKAEARFYSRSGLLIATHKGDWIELDFPSEPEKPVVAPPELTEALGIPIQYVGKNRFDYLAELESEEALRNLKPNFSILERILARGLIVTARSSSKKYDFVSRFFAPRIGIQEDSVSGSTHCCLAIFWSKRLGKSELKAYQASERGGMIGIRVNKNHVFLSGKAVTVFKGELT